MFWAEAVIPMQAKAKVKNRFFILSSG